MPSPTVSRRTLLRGGSAALAGLSVWQVSGPAEAFPGHGDDDAEDVAWSDQPSNEYPGSRPRVLPWLAQRCLFHSAKAASAPLEWSRSIANHAQREVLHGNHTPAGDRPADVPLIVTGWSTPSDPVPRRHQCHVAMS